LLVLGSKRTTFEQMSLLDTEISSLCLAKMRKMAVSSLVARQNSDLLSNQVDGRYTRLGLFGVTMTSCYAD
jgi:hypothetical protein